MASLIWDGTIALLMSSYESPFAKKKKSLPYQYLKDLIDINNSHTLGRGQPVTAVQMRWGIRYSSSYCGLGKAMARSLVGRGDYSNAL